MQLLYLKGYEAILWHKPHRCLLCFYEIKLCLFLSPVVNGRAQKKEQRKLLRVLCLQWLARHASRARTKKCKVLFTPALLEREREREYTNIWNYQIFSNLFFVFLLVLLQATYRCNTIYTFII